MAEQINQVAPRVIRDNDYFGVGVPGIVPPSPGGTSDFLRADGTWATPPSGGSPAWGDITGTLGDQTDLQSALDGKAAASHTHTGDEVSLDSGDWGDALVGSGITNVQELANWLDANLP